MKIIICVDDKNGMMFNHRRQSQDKVLRENILKTVGASPLCMNMYSSKQFGDNIPDNIYVSEDYLSEAKDGDYCFVEDEDITPYIDHIEQIILFHWNRIYPTDFRFNADILASGWKLTEAEDFAGSSHEKITKEIYDR